MLVMTCHQESIAWDGTEAPAYSDYSRQAAASTCLALCQ